MTVRRPVFLLPVFLWITLSTGLRKPRYPWEKKRQISFYPQQRFFWELYGLN